MYMESERLALPASRECLVISGDASRTIGRPGRSWQDLQRLAAFALQQLFHTGRHDAVAYVADLPFTDQSMRATTLVALYFCTDGALSEEDLKALATPFEKPDRATDWSIDGVHALSDEAFPTLAIHKGALHQLWIDPKDPVCVTLSASGLRTRRTIRTFGQSSERDFLQWVKHSVVKDPPPPRTQERERLKLAFSYRVAQRIVAADGVIDKGEKAFMEKTYLSELEEYGLTDERELDRLVVRAETELEQMLGHHEKLALLSRFFATCYSDGKLDVRELKVLKAASASLGLESQTVMQHLQKLW